MRPALARACGEFHGEGDPPPQIQLIYLFLKIFRMYLLSGVVWRWRARWREALLTVK